MDFSRRVGNNVFNYVCLLFSRESKVRAGKTRLANDIMALFRICYMIDVIFDVCGFTLAN